MKPGVFVLMHFVDEFCWECTKHFNTYEEAQEHVKNNCKNGEIVSIIFVHAQGTVENGKLIDQH